jgi:hypothetical protein
LYNNPILLIDPDGMDWFYNELTGAVFYHESFRKGAEEDMVEGWKHMGANDCSSNKDNDYRGGRQVVQDNLDLAEEVTFTYAEKR